MHGGPGGIEHLLFHQDTDEQIDRRMPGRRRAFRDLRLKKRDSGFDGIEVDVQVTSDGLAVLMHDCTMHRAIGDPRTLGDVS